MIAVIAFVYGKRGRTMVILGDFCCDFGFFEGFVTDFLTVTYPTTLGFVAEAILMRLSGH